MSDEEEESMSEGFSASEDEWKPTKDVRGGESSDDDDSDFEESPQGPGAQDTSGTGAAARRKGAPAKGTVKQTAIKKRKSAGQSLRTKLYNKYRPPPKTFPSPTSAGSNSPSASTSRTASKNVKMPNESGERGDNDSSSGSSVEDYLVNPEDIDIQSSFFNVRRDGKAKSASPPTPVFDCNIGIGKLSDSGSEDNNDSSADEEKAQSKSFDFANLLDNVNSLELAKETIAKRAAAHNKEQDANKKTGNKCNTTAMDVNSLLALGEKQNKATVRSTKGKDDGEEEDDECEMERALPQRLSKTKSTRVKRHTKTRPASTVVAGDTDDSDFEEVAEEDTTSVSHSTTHDSSALLNEGLEIHVELPTKQQRRNKEKNQQDIEMALKRKLNRDLKERFVHLHKTSLLCCFARSYRYNRMLNDTPLMQAALKLLPSANAYPPERGTEIKYYQSMVTWYKTAVKLASPNLYGEKKRKSRRRVKRELLEQIRKKEASCKQDFVFIFVILLRAMGLQCRLIVNMQPLPLRPAQADLLKVQLKRDSDMKKMKKKAEEGGKEEEAVEVKRVKLEKLKVEKRHGEKEEKAESKREEKKREKEENSRKTEKPRKEDVKSEEEHKKENAPKENSIEKPQTSRDAHRERKRAPSAKLAEMKEAQREEEAASSIKKAKKETNEVTKINETKRTQEKEANKVNVPKEKEIKTTKTSKAAEESKKDRELGDKVEAKKAKGKEAGGVSKKEPDKHKPTLARLRNKKSAGEDDKSDLLPADKPCLSVCAATPVARRTRKASTEKQATTNKAAPTTTTTTKANKSDKPTIQIGSPVVPKIVIQSGKMVQTAAEANERENQPQTRKTRETRSRSKSPKAHISPTFLQSKNYKNKFPEPTAVGDKLKPKSTTKRANSKSPTQKLHISPNFLQPQNPNVAEAKADGTRSTRILRSRQQANEVDGSSEGQLPALPQLDGADDVLVCAKKTRPKLKKLKSHSRDDESDDDFEPSPPKQPKKAPKSKESKDAKKKKSDKASVDRRVLSSDDEEGNNAVKRNPTAADIWVEAWSDAEEQWICIELFKGKLHSVEAIRKAASSSFAYVFAFQNDLSIKDVTARYCPNWTTTVRKSRVERAWLEAAFTPYYGQRTQRDLREDQELRRIHEEKPMPTSIADYKDHPLYALERHLLKFEAIYPPEPPTLGFIRGEPVYARECVHKLHSREIWLKQARTVKLGEQPYKIVKARPKWDRLTQSVIKDQPLEIFGYWQTQDYEPPTAENGIVPRNAYGNVELFKECMLPKKTVHLRLPGLSRICKKLGIDCAQAVTGFDFHQGACHPLYDGFVVCEEFGDHVTAAWYQDQEEQDKKEQDKYEARVYGNWKKLIKGLLIRERLKKKYNFEAASSTFAYVFAFQNDLSIKDVSARYCPNWTTTVRKSRCERPWLEATFTPYYGQRTQRDLREDQGLRRIHEEKPMPTSIGEYKDHPLYALERHLLKFQAIYPPNPPTLGFVRGEPVYARECVHLLRSRENWLKQARTVKLGEQPYKIVKQPKWDRLTRSILKEQPLEIFGYWQTEEYEPPTAENGLVPRNAYGNVELFKECMLPKKTVHLRLPGLNRICKKLGIDCAHAVIGFDFHQGGVHALYDGFVVCEEFGDQVTAAWHKEQEELEKKEQEKYEARVYGNWKKLIKSLLVRERLKKKYNF